MKENKKYCICGSISLVLLIGLILFLVSIEKVDQTEFVLVKNFHTKKVDKEVYGPGLYFYGLAYSSIIFPSVPVYLDIGAKDGEGTEGTDIIVRTLDGMNVIVNLLVQIQLKKEDIYDLYVSTPHKKDKILWKIRMSVLAKDAIRETISHFEVNQIYYNLTMVKNALEVSVTEEIGHNLATVKGFQFNYMKCPETYEQSIQAKIIRTQEVLAQTHTIQMAKNEKESELRLDMLTTV